MTLNVKEQVLYLEGKEYTSEMCRNLFVEQSEEVVSDRLHDLFQFLNEWFDDSPTMTVQTSGSTGTPKLLTVRKEQMMQSARLTCEFLDLQPGDNALLCMSLQYIAGKMMVVRALVAGLNLIVRTPSTHPLADVDDPIEFAAMIPMQVNASFSLPAEAKRLRRIGTLIIGGGPIDACLEEFLYPLPGKVYSTYGMTETLSHIALCRINDPEAPFDNEESSSFFTFQPAAEPACYSPLPSVSISLSPKNTLVIDAPLVCDETLVTNDIAEIHSDGTFSILGRIDNVINTGGIKVQIEQVESILRYAFVTPFAITSVTDARLGEAMVLLLSRKDSFGADACGNNPVVEDFYPIEQHLDNLKELVVEPMLSEEFRNNQVKKIERWKKEMNQNCDEMILEFMSELLPRYHSPKHLCWVDSIPMTGSGKVDRAACADLAMKLVSNVC